MIKVYPPPSLEMLILNQEEDDHEACEGFGIMGGMVRISLTTSWDRGTLCDICKKEIEVGTVWIEHLEGGCTQEPCPHGAVPIRDGLGADCTLMRHDKIHFRHLSRNFSCFPVEARERAEVHWKGKI